MKRTNPQRQRSRSAGILLHVTSLPGEYGIGDLGPAAHAWVDALARAKQTWWQVLPLGPPGAGFSPYQSFSAFAGNPLLISPELMAEEGLLQSAELKSCSFPEDAVDYERVTAFKLDLLDRAWERFRTDAARSLQQPFQRFCRQQRDWLDDFALFMALRELHGHLSWTEWPRELVVRDRPALDHARRHIADAVERHQFAQFLFFRQLGGLREYARSRGIKLIGDLPIFVSGDSSDIWAHPELFQLDRHRRPRAVAGVPPDYFSKTGQRWGNPLYNWRAMERDGFAWWVRRVRATLAQVDLVRIDHFRGFEAYWAVPADSPTAEKGRWVQAPGEAFFTTMRRELGSLPFIAEDLGLITPRVEALRDAFELPGMRVLQFAFGGDFDNPFLPHRYVQKAVAYTGTHDNDTTAGWYASLSRKERSAVQRYVPGIDGDPAWAMIRLAWGSVADCAIAPVQDVLRLGSEARMNTPGTPEGNWRWRLSDKGLDPKRLDQLGELTETYGRAPSANAASAELKVEASPRSQARKP